MVVFEGGIFSSGHQWCLDLYSHTGVHEITICDWIRQNPAFTDKASLGPLCGSFPVPISPCKMKFAPINLLAIIVWVYKFLTHEFYLVFGSFI